MAYQFSYPRSDTEGLARRRRLILLSLFGILFLLLLSILFRLQIFEYDAFGNKVLNQITVGSSLSAKRGIIYDRNGVILAESKTVWRIYISPVNIKKASLRKGESYGEIIANGLSELLDVDADIILQKAQKSAYLDQTIKKNVDEETTTAVLLFAKENGLSKMIHAEAGTRRYYPYGSLAAHVLGFTGSDGQGLYGIEAYYNKLLSGEDGKYISAVDSQGVRLPLSFSDFIEARNGAHLTTTLDLYVQTALERSLEEAVIASDVKNRATGIVMDVTNGEVLGMATYPAFDLNDPYTLDAASEEKLAASGLTVGSMEYKAFKNELLYTTWRNKAISEIYEPGSTFKIITAAAALESGAISASTPFVCHGSYTVGGCRISCHKRTGHGALSFAEGLMQSCNPVMMQSAERLGKESFYRYYTSFGYLRKTGIDLPSEATGLFHSFSSLGTTELATASFGQRFKVSPIAHLTAIATVANDGIPVTPHFLSSVSDEDGSILYRYAAEEKEAVLSSRTAELVASILEEGVSGDGGSKNAYVEGYRIAAKTGTSEKFDILDANGRSFLRIGSCVAFAPYDNARYAVLLMVDEPTSQNKYGSVTAAPYVSSLLSSILPYLGVEKTEEPLSVAVPSLEGMSLSKAKATVSSLGISTSVIGNGESVIRQVPAPGTIIRGEGGRVLLYTEESSLLETVIPSLEGKELNEALRLLSENGLNAVIKGTNGKSIEKNAIVISQSLPPDLKVLRGERIEIRVLHQDDSE